MEVIRCLGCEAKQDAEDMVPEKRRRGLHFFFRRWRQDDEL